MTQILVSVIVPVERPDIELSSCLNSIHSQSLKNIEIIFVSNVNFFDKIEHLSKIRFISGNTLTDSLNKGIQAAQGLYVFFLNPLDSLGNYDSLSNLYANAVVFQKDLFFGNTGLFFKHSGCIKKINFNLSDFHKKNFYINDDFIKLSISLSPYNKLISKRFLLDNKISFSDILPIESAFRLFTFKLLTQVKDYEVYHEITYCLSFRRILESCSSLNSLLEELECSTHYYLSRNFRSVDNIYEIYFNCLRKEILKNLFD